MQMVLRQSLHQFKDGECSVAKTFGQPLVRGLGRQPAHVIIEWRLFGCMIALSLTHVFIPLGWSARAGWRCHAPAPSHYRASLTTLSTTCDTASGSSPLRASSDATFR